MATGPTRTSPFVVLVARLRRPRAEAAHEVRRGEVEQAGPLREAGIDPGRSVVPAGAEAEVEVTLRPFEGGIDVEGTVTAPWEGICRRCAEPVTGELRIPVHERFADAPLAGPSDEDLYPIVDDTIDLGPLVRDAIVLELPMAPLCRDDCAGLCPQCGANRNEGDCGCVAPRDPRWANLDVLR
ncbi:MAG TPA: DUF177 domain-containing protein [Acidimicrobiales bacterium]|nr:DUF177 domain-containing protein [Acidimicrobiales bacterium]